MVIWKKLLKTPNCYIILSIILAYAILFIGFYKEENNMTAATITALSAIGVALLGAASGIWTQVVQFKKDAQRIDGVNDTASSVKSDTSDMKPRVCNIEENVKDIRKEVMEHLASKYNQLDGITSLVNEMEYQKRRQNEISSSLLSPDYFIDGIKNVYDENARLNEQVKALEREVAVLKQEVLSLKNKAKYQDIDVQTPHRRR